MSKEIVVQFGEEIFSVVYKDEKSGNMVLSKYEFNAAGYSIKQHYFYDGKTMVKWGLEGR